MSVVVLTPDRFETIRTTLNHLRAQTVREQLEILLMGPLDEGSVDATALEGFHSWRIIPVEVVETTAEPRALGTGEAMAPVVAFAEDHAWPEPQWAAALIAAHQGPYAAVGPTLLNGNPGKAQSWADMLLNFGPWIDRRESGPAAGTPWHNTSYKRDVLLSYGDRLAAFLDVEGALHEDLCRRGPGVYFETKARVRHVNVSGLAGIAMEQFTGARRYAASRSEFARWGFAKRVFYAAGCVVLPLLKVRRALRDLDAVAGPHPSAPAVFPALAYGALVGSIGEACGYLFGRGDAQRTFTRLEFHRESSFDSDVPV